MPNESLDICCVCGMLQSFFPWGEDEASPSYRKCPCCGTNFGLDDCNFKEIVQRRISWIAGGMDWDCPERKPDDWDPQKQLRQVPEEWTLESLGLGPNDTLPHLTGYKIRDAGWSPDVIDYFHFAAFSKIPTESQTNNFVEALSKKHSWYKHLPLLPPGAQFVVYLNPYAGHAFDAALRTQNRGGPRRPIELVSRDQKHFQSNDIPTREYLERFGTWDYAVLNNSVLNDADLSNLNQVELNGFIREKTPLPEILLEKGTCYLTGYLKPSPTIAHRVNREFVHSNQFRAWSNAFLTKLGTASEESRVQILIYHLKRCKGDISKLDNKTVDLLEQESLCQKEKIHAALKRVTDYFESLRVRSAKDFAINFREVIWQVATDKVVVFFENPYGGCSVIGPESVCGRVFGLTDPEYGWPSQYQINNITADQCTPKQREHPIITDGERYLAGCISLAEYRTIVESLREEARCRYDCVNDREILSEFIEVRESENTIDVFLKTISWQGPYTSETSFHLVDRLPAGIALSLVEDTIRKLLQSPSYFDVCICCEKRKRVGSVKMECCEACGNDGKGIIH